MTIKGGELLGLILGFGEIVLSVDGDLVKDALLLYPKPNFPFYDKKLIRLLANGTISQVEYDQRKAYDGDVNALYNIKDSEQDNDTLINTAIDLGYTDVAGDTLLQTVINLNALGLQIII